MRAIWIDLDNAPHVHFFAPIIRELARRSFETIVTVREFGQTVELARWYGFEFTLVGRHGLPNTTAGRVTATMQRAGLLVRHMLRAPRPLAAISHGSRALTLAAALLRIPVVSLFDYEFVSTGVFFGLSRRVLMPEVVAAGLAKRRRNVIGYPGLKEEVYVYDVTPDARVLDQLALDPSKVIVTVRPPATWAHYHDERSELLFKALMRRLADEPRIQVVILARTADQERQLSRDYDLGANFVLRSRAVDGLSLIWYSDAVLSGGGTMIRESALLGIPSYSTFASAFGAADRYLVECGRLRMLDDPAAVASLTFPKRRPADFPRSSTITRDFIIDQILDVAKN